jgi:hypothetical protein
VGYWQRSGRYQVTISGDAVSPETVAAMVDKRRQGG